MAAQGSNRKALIIAGDGFVNPPEPPAWFTGFGAWKSLHVPLQSKLGFAPLIPALSAKTRVGQRSGWLRGIGIPVCKPQAGSVLRDFAAND